MLGKHIIAYIPSLIVPAITSFGAIFCYTRLLTPHQYGNYALALNGMVLLNAVFFYALQAALPRIMPQYTRQGHERELRVTTYFAFLPLTALLLLGAFLFTGIVPLAQDMRTVTWLAVLLAIARSMLNVNQAVHRSKLNFKSYNVIECGQALLGLGMGLTLVYFMDVRNTGAILGMIFGMGCMVFVDIRSLMETSPKYFSRTALMEILRFGIPLMLAYGFYFITAFSDRFIIEHFRGASDVGIYAAGFSLMDRINTLVFMIVATPSFPLTVYKLEHEGIESAREQTYRNGVAVLSIAMPACAGLILCNTQLAAVLIGSEFRGGTMQVMPWIAGGAILNGLSTHYFDHAFHLAKKPHLLLFTQGLTAAFSLTMNLMLIPRYGYMGAVYSNVCSYMLLLTLSICVGRRVFRVRFPFLPALQIAGAVALMALALTSIRFPNDLFGLAAMVTLGGAVYGATILVLNVSDVRGKAIKIVRLVAHIGMDKKS